MKRIVHLNEQIKLEIAMFENQCEDLGKMLQGRYENDFHKLTETLIIELIREKRGRPVTQEELFSDSYKSYIEIGVEIDEVYYPNGYIPIWKCQIEMFHPIGYLINLNLENIEKKLQEMIIEIYEDHRKERGL